MTDDPRPADHDPLDGPAPHVDPISEVEAEADAEIPDVEVELEHLAHPHPEGPRVAPDTFGAGPAPDPRADRQRFLVIYLRVALALAFVVGVLELLLPEEARDEAATVMVAVFVAAPLGRVAWLIVRWLRRGDWRFALVGLTLLAVVATGFLAR